MKSLVTSLFVFMCLTTFSQTNEQPNRESGVSMGLSGGYSSKQSIIGTITAGAIVHANNHVSLNMVIPGNIRNVDIPTIGEVRLGHFFQTFEVYGGVGYHVAGADNKIKTNPNTGIRPALGLIKHFTSSPWTISASMSGNIFSMQLGLFGVK